MADLRSYFAGVGGKVLSAVEAEAARRSNQHELNGARALLAAGLEPDRQYRADYFYFTDEEEDILDDPDRTLRLYDARKAQPKRAAEYRLYYPAGLNVMASAREGDLCFVALRPDDHVTVIVAPHESIVGQRLDYLFGTNVTRSDGPLPGFSGHPIAPGQQQADAIDAMLLERLGLATPLNPAIDIDDMLHQFSGRMPSVAHFTNYARQSLPVATGHDDPDTTLANWWERTNDLFVAYDDHLTTELIKATFNDPEKRTASVFYQIFRSRQNARFSRAGKTLEHHISALLDLHRIPYSWGAAVPGEAIPDFLFPGIKQYTDLQYPTAGLAVLAAKTSLRERWAQVGDEAHRIPRKHILTLEKSVPQSKTDRMQGIAIQLVVPRPYQTGYSPSQLSWLQDVSGFFDELRSKGIILP